MKNIILKIAVVLTLSLTYSCSDATSIDLCDNTVCQNGGYCETGLCDCPEDYTGVYCESQLTPSKIKIVNFRVTSFPNSNEGYNWDTNSAPDIFIRLGKGNGNANTTLLYESNYYENVTSSGSNYFDFTPTTPIVINSPTEIYSLILLDYDFTSPYEVMAGGAFYVYNQENDFPAKITIENTAIPFSCELWLQYEW